MDVWKRTPHVAASNLKKVTHLCFMGALSWTLIIESKFISKASLPFTPDKNRTQNLDFDESVYPAVK